MTRWLLRNGRQSHYELLGPMERESVLEAIRTGKVDLNDELCAEGGYWFSFHESDELHKNLGVSWSQLKKELNEGTLAAEETTQSEESEEETDEILRTPTNPEAARPGNRRKSEAPPQSEVEGSLAPPWFWGVVLLAILAALVRLFGSTK